MSTQGINARSLGGIAPSILFLAIVYITPVAAFLSRAFVASVDGSTPFQIVLFSETYRAVLANTVEISVLVTILAFFLGYPLAYACHKSRGYLRSFLLLAVVLPFWVSFLVRTFSLMAFLRKQGILNELLVASGLMEQPIRLLYNRTGAILGMTYMLFPYMVLAVFVVLERLDERLVRASASLGASDRQVFWTTVFPLSLPGVAVGSTLVFVLSLGFFVTPALMGGRHEQVISMVIEDQINTVLNWEIAAGLSVVLVFATLLTLLAAGFVFKRYLGLKGIS